MPVRTHRHLDAKYKYASIDYTSTEYDYYTGNLTTNTGTRVLSQWTGLQVPYKYIPAPVAVRTVPGTL